MNLEKDRQHADNLASFFCQLAVAFVAGSFLQVILQGDIRPAQSAMLFITGFFLLGISHIVVERAYGASA